MEIKSYGINKFSMLKKISKFIIGLFIVLVIGVVIFYFIGKTYFYNIPILMYHHVDYFEGDNSLYVSLNRFSNQIDFIVNKGYQILTLDKFIDYVKGNKKIEKKNLVLLTFDDGYSDNYENVYKILKQYGIGGIFFVPVNRIGQEGRLTRQQILEMDLNGMIFGSHTMSECYLPSVSVKQARIEIFKSKEVLEALLDEEIKSIAYCIGGYDKKVLELVREAGYKIAFTTNRGFEKDLKNDSLYELRRIKVTDRDNNFKLWAKLTGFYNLFRSIKEPY